MASNHTGATLQSVQTSSTSVFASWGKIHTSVSYHPKYTDPVQCPVKVGDFLPNVGVKSKLIRKK